MTSLAHQKELCLVTTKPRFENKRELSILRRKLFTVRLVVSYSSVTRQLLVSYSSATRQLLVSVNSHVSTSCVIFCLSSCIWYVSCIVRLPDTQFLLFVFQLHSWAGMLRWCLLVLVVWKWCNGKLSSRASFIPDSVTRQQMCSCISSCISDKKSYKKSKRVVVI